jgi:hypothetical protein
MANVPISSGVYEAACEDDEGWCTTCQEFTANNVEPDARDYQCQCCGEHTVMGAEEALVCMEIEVGEE